MVCGKAEYVTFIQFYLDKQCIIMMAELFTTHKNWQLCEVMDMLTKLIVVIISCGIHVSNYHIIHFEYIVVFVNQSVRLKKIK